MAHEGHPISEFSRPGGIVVVHFDPATGLLAYPGQVDAVDEEFLDGTAPNAVATVDAGAPDASRAPDGGPDDEAAEATRGPLPEALPETRELDAGASADASAEAPPF